MATSKTLAPTNVTISIPAMTDQPDASVFSNCVDKEADAINALNSQITPQAVTPTVASDSTGKVTIDYNNCYRVGKIVVINLRFSITSAIATGTLVFDGLPKAATSIQAGRAFGVVATNKDGLIFGLCPNNNSDATAIATTDAVTAQTPVIVSGAYIAS